MPRSISVPLSPSNWTFFDICRQSSPLRRTDPTIVYEHKQQSNCLWASANLDTNSQVPKSTEPLVGLKISWSQSFELLAASILTSHSMKFITSNWKITCASAFCKRPHCGVELFSYSQGSSGYEGSQAEWKVKLLLWIGSLVGRHINSGKNRSSESCIQTRNVFKNVLAFVRSRQRIKIATYIATSGF